MPQLWSTPRPLKSPTEAALVLTSPKSASSKAMHHLFGKKKAPEPKPGVTEATAQLKAHVETMEKRQAFLQQKIEAELANAKAASRVKDKRKAMMALKKKKLYESEQTQLANTQFQIEQQMMMLGQANMAKQTVGAMKTGAAAIKDAQQNLNLDDVEDVMDDVRDGMEEMAEVNEVLAQGFGDTMDETEFEDEFAALEEELLDEQLMDISAPAAGVPAQATPDPVAAVATDAPQPEPASADATEDDELAALEAQMAM